MTGPILAIAAIFGLVPFAAYRYLRSLPSPTAAFTLALGLVTALGAAPFLLPRGMYFWRACLATMAVSGAVKIVEFKKGRLSDPSVATKLGRFWVWSLVPPDTRWPKSETARRANVKRGLSCLGRCSLKSGLFFLLLFASQKGYTNGLSYAASVVWTAVQFYLFMTLLLDGLIAAVMLGGLAVDEIFDRPFFARSPSDFWSRRWNLYISRFAARYIFLPLGGGRRRVSAMLAVFAASAVMHEYLVLAIFWPAQKLGYMSLFFGLQAIAVLAHHGWLRFTRGRWRLRPALAVLLHSLWFLPTTALFFEPLGPLLQLWGIAWRPLP